MARTSTTKLVAAIREAGGYSQEALARDLDVSFATVNAWERGRSEPRANHLRQLHELAARFGIREELSVLVIDDDPTACTVVEGLVAGSRTPTHIETTTDPQRGLILAGSMNPDLLMVDVLMPGLDGFEVARQLDDLRRDEAPHIMFFTASSDPEVEERAHALGYGIMLKPLYQEAINELLESVAAGKLPAWA